MESEFKSGPGTRVKDVCTVTVLTRASWRSGGAVLTAGVRQAAGAADTGAVREDGGGRVRWQEGGGRQAGGHEAARQGGAARHQAQGGQVRKNPETLLKSSSTSVPTPFKLFLPPITA